MTRYCFKAITYCLYLTSRTALTFVDKFWEIREMIIAWNANMVAVFAAAWVVCLDESMLIWHDRWICPGWVFCPCKPHTFGNEYHSARCALVCDKDHPKDLGKPQYEELGKMVGLLVQMLSSVFTTGQCVVLDLGFCIFKELVELRPTGLCGTTLIKKRRYWPTPQRFLVMQ